MPVSPRNGLVPVHATEAEVRQDLVAAFGTWMTPARPDAALGADCNLLAALVSKLEQLTRGVPSGAIVLDVGCRTGGIAYRYAIARPDVHVIGLDQSPRMLRELRLNANGVPRTVLLPGSNGALARLVPPACTRNLLTLIRATSELPMRDASVSAAVVSLCANASDPIRELSRVTRDFAPALFVRRSQRRGATGSLVDAIGRDPCWQGVRAITPEGPVDSDSSEQLWPELAWARRAPRKRR